MANKYACGNEVQLGDTVRSVHILGDGIGIGTTCYVNKIGSNGDPITEQELKLNPECSVGYSSTSYELVSRLTLDQAFPSPQPVGVEPTSQSHPQPTTVNPTQQLIRDTCDSLRETLIGKNRDYGGSVFHPPKLNRNLSAKDAITVRLSDKFARLENLLSSSTEPANESVEDTYLDIAGYCLLELVRRQLEKQTVTGQ